MGYSTDFDGGIGINKLTHKQVEFLNSFSRSRRMKRNVDELMRLYNGKNGLPGTSPTKNTPEEIYGIDGAYYVGDTGNDSSVFDGNTPPGQRSYVDMNESEGQPGLWCQWIVEPSEETAGFVLKWDEGEKFYKYVEWLNYLIKHFFDKWGCKLNGDITWAGESSDDFGKIEVKKNIVKVYDGAIVYKQKK